MRCLRFVSRLHKTPSQEALDRMPERCKLDFDLYGCAFWFEDDKGETTRVDPTQIQVDGTDAIVEGRRFRGALGKT